MHARSLPRLCEEQLAAARSSTSGRSAVTLYGGQEHDLRQTMIALAAGQRMPEHDSPAEATLQVLAGQVRITSGEQSWQGRAGDLLIIPPDRHALEADTDAAVLLTVATRA